jgi:hypothetical protein
MIPRYAETQKNYSSLAAIKKTNPSILDPNRQEEKRQEEEYLAITDDPSRILD